MKAPLITAVALTSFSADAFCGFYVAGGGAELFMRSASYGFPIRAGALRDNELGSTYVTGGIGIANIKWGIDIAARREVKGGDETLLLASMRFYGPRMPAPGVQ